MEADRERMRQHIRDKVSCTKNLQIIKDFQYNLKKKEEAREQEIAGRIAGNRKTPEQVALESINTEEEDGELELL